MGSDRLLDQIGFVETGGPWTKHVEAYQVHRSGSRFLDVGVNIWTKPDTTDFAKIGGSWTELGEAYQFLFPVQIWFPVRSNLEVQMFTLTTGMDKLPFAFVPYVTNSDRQSGIIHVRSIWITIDIINLYHRLLN